MLNNGEENETKIYAYGETVELDTYFTKEGYIFAGWYANEDLSGEEVTQIDSLHPSDITLYAKWVEAGSQDNSSASGSDDTSEGSSSVTESGCGSAFAASFAAFAAAGFAAVLLAKKKRKED